MALDRRGFLKFAIGGAVGTLFTPLPWKLADDVAIWTQNWPWIPRIPRGEVIKKYTVVKYPPYEYGAQVNIVNGNPITLGGKKGHYLSRGGVEAVGLSSVGLLYSPARITSPLIKRKGKLTPISWEEGEKLLLQWLEEHRGREDSLLFISGDNTSSSSEIFSAFVSAMNSSLYFFEPSDRNIYFSIWYNLFNGEGEIGFDLENTDHLLVVGCNLLDSWGTPVRNQRLFGERSWDITCISPVEDNTAVVANRWMCVPRNKLYKVVLAIASSLLSMKSRIPGLPGMEKFISYVTQNFPPGKIAAEIGIKEKDIQGEAKRLLKSKSPLVIGGSPCNNGGGDRSTIAACILLNVLLGNINKKGGIRCIPRPPKVINSAAEQKDILLKDLVEYIEKGNLSRTKMAFFYETNPLYSLPPHIREKLKNIPYKISFSTFLDETARDCDLILPSAHFLEREDDCYTPFGSGEANYSAYERALSPIYKGRSISDFILSIAKRLSIDLGVSSYKNLLKTKAEYLGVKIEQLVKGKVWTDNTVETPYGLRVWSKDIEALFNKKEEGDKYSLELIPLAISKIGTPYTGIPPLNLKVIYEDELTSKGFFVSINPETAASYHLKEGDKVELKSAGGKCRALIKITNGIARDSIGAPLGFGHQGWDEFNRNKGDNTANLFYAKKKTASGYYDFSEVRVTLTKI